MAEHNLYDSIVNEIVERLEAQVDETVEKLGVPPGMTEQTSAAQATRTIRQGLGSGDPAVGKAMIDRAGGPLEVARLLEEEENGSQ